MVDRNPPNRRDVALLATAEEVFARYGYRRVSMVLNARRDTRQGSNLSINWAALYLQKL